MKKTIRKAGKQERKFEHTKIRMPKDVTRRIRRFWDCYGAPGAAMLSQPVWRHGRYTLRIRMIRPGKETETIDTAINSLASSK